MTTAVATKKRLHLELQLLEHLFAGAELGVPFSDLRSAFPRGPLIPTLNRLVERGQVHCYEGGFYHVTPFGRSRLEGRPAR